MSTTSTIAEEGLSVVAAPPGATSELQKARILTYGYDSAVANFFGSQNQQNISGHGNDLMVALQQERKEEVRRWVIATPETDVAEAKSAPHLRDSQPGRNLGQGGKSGEIDHTDTFNLI
ncbi:hypothetical protein IL306_008074 [Fusarium sp. DS 682]|nr:hypothetical protein IL306_008074 [Fusarium sp. DS 682]